jgi:ATP-dependent DNA helicase DinG
VTPPRGSVISVPGGDLLHDATSPRRALPDIAVLLDAAVEGIGGSERPGQVAMAHAVQDAIDSGRHLAVQAGTGTGKSLAYLVPAVRHAIATGSAIVVSTATIALQRQLIDRDLPRLATALKPLLEREPVFAILKGRRNYLCVHRLRVGAPDDPAEVLFDARATSATGRQVQRLHQWAETTTTGDRDELVPGVDERAWRQVAVSARECLGTRCPLRADCFAERARDEAAEADIVVTNHALLAIDALEDFQVLPEHGATIIDEAHDLVDRITSVASAELTAAIIETGARRCTRFLDDGTARGAAGASQAPGVAEQLRKAGEALAPVLSETPAGRLDALPEPLAVALAAAREAAHECAAELRPVLKRNEEDTERLSAGRLALTSVEEIQETATRLLRSFDAEIAARREVVWMDLPQPDDTRRAPTLRIAPIEVGGLLAERLFGRHTAILTSATLALGGSFEPLAVQWGLPPGGGGGQAHDSAAAGEKMHNGSANARATAPAPTQGGDQSSAETGDQADEPASLAWSGVDVGSPFNHPRSGILYVAQHLPPPGRDGLPEAYLTELCELITAAGGRTLGLFSSMRAAKQAAGELRDRIDHPLLCQGDDATALLIRQFAEDEPTCLFGTLSLWQGVDVPGPSLQLVVIDRIPFPRPDDPLASARQRLVAARGGNGFMAVAATTAALLLAQGSGRLLRTTADRGVVAVLDPRLVTKRYGRFLRESLPPFWTTTDPGVVRAALRRLAGP